MIHDDYDDSKKVAESNVGT